MRIPAILPMTFLLLIMMSLPDSGSTITGYPDGKIAVAFFIS